MQAPSQYARPPGHAQLRALQCAPPPQATPQAPQFKSSAAKSAHERLPQVEKPRGQQTPPGATVPHPLQPKSAQMPSAQPNGVATGAVSALTGLGGGPGEQLLPRERSGLPSPSQWPMSAPGSVSTHTFPQTPQLFGSVARLTHAPPHMAPCEPGQAQTPS